MSVDFHEDPVRREQIIARYLERRLNGDQAVQWETHYLACQDCFEEMRASEWLIHGLGEPLVERKRINDVTVLTFAHGTQLLAASLELSELSKAIRLESDTKVLIDLSRVSRIDSTGLGVLMQHHCHAVRNAGALKLLRPDGPVRRVLNVTKIDSVLQTFEDEGAAIASFGHSG
jgi:anti-sigma B factor antagonist